MTEMFLGVFGDIHGRISLMYTLAALWEQRSGNTLSGLLQVGDFGAFPENKRIPNRILRQAKMDPDLLGFKQFYKETEEGAMYLGRREAPVSLFIRGNQEDFHYLSNVAQPSFVDPWKRLYYLSDGSHAQFSAWQESTWSRSELLGLRGSGLSVKVAGFGGVPPGSGSRRGKSKGKSKQGNYKSEIPPDCFDPDIVEQSFLEEADIDVLLTHEGPLCLELQSGSTHLARLAERLAPKFHFFGHHYFSTGPCCGPGGATLVGLDHLQFEKDGRLRDSSWGILHITPYESSFVMATHHSLDWLQEVRANTYRTLFP